MIQSAPLIPIANISKLNILFDRQVVLEDINLELYKNRVHLLNGASGAGKTTFLRALNRLNDCFDRCRTSGNIELFLGGAWHKINQLPDSQLPALRKQVGMVFQHPQLLPGTVQDNLLLPLKVLSQLTGEKAQQKIYHACHKAALWDEIKDRLQQPATSLSGGQQQRLCLARTLVLEPEILLLDEPTASLDPAAAAKIEECIQQLASDYTIVMVSHSQPQAEKLADYIHHFEQGRIITSNCRNRS